MNIRYKKYRFPYEENTLFSVNVFADEDNAKEHIFKHFIKDKREVSQWTELLGTEFADLVQKAKEELIGKNGKISDAVFDALYEIIADRAFADFSWILSHPQYILLQDKTNKKFLAVSEYGYFLVAFRTPKTRRIMSIFYQVANSPRDAEILERAIRTQKESVRYKQKKGRYSKITYFSENTWGVKPVKKPKKAKWKEHWEKARKTGLSENSTRFGNSNRKQETGSSLL